MKVKLLRKLRKNIHLIKVTIIKDSEVLKESIVYDVTQSGPFSQTEYTTRYSTLKEALVKYHNVLRYKLLVSNRKEIMKHYKVKEENILP
jgi:hypothetical protein